MYYKGNFDKIVEYAEGIASSEVHLEEYSADVVDLVNSLSLPFNLDWFDQTRILLIPIVEWTCTDTRVGHYAVILDGTFVGLGFKPYRKYDMHYYWKNAESLHKITNALYELAIERHEELFMQGKPFVEFENKELFFEISEGTPEHTIKIVESCVEKLYEIK